MPISKRTAICDICEFEQEEQRVGTGWQGWSILQGIAAKAPEPGVPLDNVNMETYCCPRCTAALSDFITQMQHREKTS